MDLLLRQRRPLQEEILIGERSCASDLSSGERLFAGGHLFEVGKEELKEIASSKLNIAQRILKALADVFVPILPALVASGLLMGLNNLLTAEGLFISGETVIGAYPQFADLAEMINIFANIF